jgi:hypothetical protein
LRINCHFRPFFVQNARCIKEKGPLFQSFRQFPVILIWLTFRPFLFCHFYYYLTIFDFYLLKLLIAKTTGIVNRTAGLISLHFALQK